jgi:hypothetical protein
MGRVSARPGLGVSRSSRRSRLRLGLCPRWIRHAARPMFRQLERPAPPLRLHQRVGTSGTYVPIAGKVLCGRTVDSAGDIVGLGSVGGAQFSVPNCAALDCAAGRSSAGHDTSACSPTAVRLLRRPFARRARPGLVSRLGPGRLPELVQQLRADVRGTLGAPYGTLSFGGGGRAKSSVHIGQMWPGTYTWHVKGRSSSGQETSWSANRSFTIQSVTGPVVTNPPAPIVTDRPPPCQFEDGGAGDLLQRRGFHRTVVDLVGAGWEQRYVFGSANRTVPEPRVVLRVEQRPARSPLPGRERHRQPGSLRRQLDERRLLLEVNRVREHLPQPNLLRQ